VEVILLESLNKLGNIGDLVTVKDGYARNYLIPQKKALRANDENKEYFSKIKKDLVEKNKKIIEDAKLIVQKISKLEVIFIRNASDNGQLYGSVSPKDVSNYFTEKKINIKPSNVNFHDAIKKIGIYEINIRLHPEVGCNLKINIATSEENAINQKNEFEKPKKRLENSKSEKITGKKKELNHSSENAGQEIKIPRTKDKVNSDTSKDDEKNKNLKTYNKDSSENKINDDSHGDQKEPNKSGEEKSKKKKEKE
jgi:large subunit ribosomal protein L9